MAVRGKEHDLKSSSLAEQFEFQSGRGLSPRHVEESCSCRFERLQRRHLVSLSLFFNCDSEGEGITIFEASVNI